MEAAIAIIASGGSLVMTGVIVWLIIKLTGTQDKLFSANEHGYNLELRVVTLTQTVEERDHVITEKAGEAERLAAALKKSEESRARIIQLVSATGASSVAGQLLNDELRKVSELSGASTPTDTASPRSVHGPTTVPARPGAGDDGDR